MEPVIKLCNLPVVLGSAKAVMMEDAVLKNQRGWIPKYAHSEGQFLPIFLKQLSAIHYLEGTDQHGKKLYEVSLNNLRAYHIRGKTWHELTQQDGSLVALRFTDDREFDSFYQLLQGLLLGLNKLKATPTGRQDDSVIYDELVIFHVQQLKLNMLERTRSSPSDRSVGPPLPPRQSPKQHPQRMESFTDRIVNGGTMFRFSSTFYSHFLGIRNEKRDMIKEDFENSSAVKLEKIKELTERLETNYNKLMETRCYIGCLEGNRKKIRQAIDRLKEKRQKMIDTCHLQGCQKKDPVSTDCKRCLEANRKKMIVSQNCLKDIRMNIFQLNDYTIDFEANRKKLVDEIDLLEAEWDTKIESLDYDDRLEARHNKRKVLIGYKERLEIIRKEMIESTEYNSYWEAYIKKSLEKGKEKEILGFVLLFASSLSKNGNRLIDVHKYCLGFKRKDMQNLAKLKKKSENQNNERHNSLQGISMHRKLLNHYFGTHFIEDIRLNRMTLQTFCQPIAIKLRNYHYMKIGSFEEFRQNVQKLQKKFVEMSTILTIGQPNKTVLDKYIHFLKSNEDKKSLAEEMITDGQLQDFDKEMEMPRFARPSVYSISYDNRVLTVLCTRYKPIHEFTPMNHPDDQFWREQQQQEKLAARQRTDKNWLSLAAQLAIYRDDFEKERQYDRQIKFQLESIARQFLMPDGYAQVYRNKIQKKFGRSALESLSTMIETKLDNNGYVKSGGFNAFKQDLDDLKRNLQRIFGPLTRTMRVMYQQYVESLKPEEEAIRLADQRITNSQLKLEAVREKVQQMELQYETEEKKVRMKQAITRKRWSTMKQLKKVLEKANQEYFEDLLKQQLLGCDGFNDKAWIMNSPMEEIKCLDSKNWISSKFGLY